MATKKEGLVAMGGRRRPFIKGKILYDVCRDNSFRPLFKTNSTKYSCSFSLVSLLTKELKDQWKSKIGKGPPAQTSEQPTWACTIAGRGALSQLSSCTSRLEAMGNFAISFPRSRTALWVLAECLEMLYLWWQPDRGHASLPATHPTNAPCSWVTMVGSWQGVVAKTEWNSWNKETLMRLQSLFSQARSEKWPH